MALTLTSYQIAVLQEMDICVWARQSDVNIVQPDTVDATTSGGRTSAQVNKNDPIAQLRAAIGAEPSAKDTASEPDSLSSMPAAPTPPPEKRLNKAELGSIATDIDLAIEFLAPQANLKWIGGDKLGVSSSQIIFPVNAPMLSPAQKRALWQQLCKVF